MSRKTSIPKKTILGDRGIQTYRSCDKGFTDSMRVTTFKEVKNAAGDARIVRESEFAKPYGEQYEEPFEDFSAMEYGAPNIPPWGWDYPSMVDLDSPWHVTFLCGGEFCYCLETSRSFDAECGWEIIGAEFVPSWNEVGVSFDKTNVFTYGLATAAGCGTLTITMKAKFKSGDKYQTVIGTHSGIQVCKCSDDECDECDDTAIAWDSVNSPETIARSTAVTVYITDSLGTGGPYTWAVSGTGFTLDDATTAGLTNTLNADGSACGSAVITVTGCDVTEAIGYVRCTAGSTWSAPADFCTTPDGWVMSTYCTLVHKQYRDVVVCGCIDPNSCPPHTPHPCGALTGCTPNNPVWFDRCAYTNCDDYWCIAGKTMTRNWIFRETWICS